MQSIAYLEQISANHFLIKVNLQENHLDDDRFAWLILRASGEAVEMGSGVQSFERVFDQDTEVLGTYNLGQDVNKKVMILKDRRTGSVSVFEFSCQEDTIHGQLIEDEDENKSILPRDSILEQLQQHIDLNTPKKMR